MSKIKNKTLSIICCILISIFPCAAIGQEGLVTQLEKGDTAPFKGVLLSQETAAKLFADIKFADKECTLRISKESDQLKINYESLLKKSELKLNVESDRLNAMIAVRDDRIKFLEEKYSPPAWYESGEFWFALGIVAGIGITTAAGYAIGQAK